MKSFRDKVCVITGAGSGIGRALAYRLADEGARVAVSDVNQEGLDETAAEVARRGAEVHAARLDVADREAFYAYADEVVEHFGAVHMIINNAGVALSATVREMTYEDFEWLMGINFWGVVYGTKAFLPYLERATEGHIVNISSVFGIIGVPTQSAYNAAKFAVRGFTEALRQELELSGGKVSCTSVHPGGIKTNIARASRQRAEALGDDTPESTAARFDKVAQTTPDEAARTILEGVRKDAKRVLIGKDAHVIDAMQRALPTGYQKLVTRAVTRR